MKNLNLKFIGLGLLFSIFWASASVSAKIGLRSVQPLVLYQYRFGTAAVIMLIWAHVIKREKLPDWSEFKQIAVMGLLNVTLSLGIFIIAIQEVAAGIGAMQVSVNPLLITVLSSVFLGRTLRRSDIIALVLGITGIGIAAYPLLLKSYATPKGLILLVIGMFAYSSAAIYYSKVKWQSSRLSINAWQVFLGGLYFFPLTIFMYESELNTYDLIFACSVFWLAVPISVLASSLWLRLLSLDTVKASFFLFLCPIFGFIYAYFILNEPFTFYTLSGLLMVLLALYIGQKKAG